MRESNIPQEIINHIKSFTPRDKPVSIELGILVVLFVYYRNVRI